MKFQNFITKLYNGFILINGDRWVSYCTLNSYYPYQYTMMK